MKKNLIDHFLQTTTGSGETKTMVLAAMNAALDTNHSLSRLGEWHNGKRAVPENIQRYMLQLALPAILRAHQLDVPSLEDDYINTLADALMPPERK